MSDSDPQSPEFDAQWQQAVEANFFLQALSASEFHWFFVQGLEALRAGLYLPGTSALLNGIEASLRVTMRQVTPDPAPGDEFALSPYKVLSNVLIATAREAGMPVEVLAFPGEADFLEKLATPKQARVDVDVVRLRNDICHGNIIPFVIKVDDDIGSIFTPECLREVATDLLGVTFTWAKALGDFRREKGLPHSGPTPPIPAR
jgi:hypothetical protein